MFKLFSTSLESLISLMVGKMDEVDLFNFYA